MKQHKWHKEIKAWADGSEIEDRVLYEGVYTDWQTAYDTPDWNNTWHEYRIKPQPKEPQYLYVYEGEEMNPELNEEFTRWYERFFLQSPSLASLQYDDEKMWEAWKAGYKLGRDNAYKRKDCPPEIFTIPKEKHIHTMNEEKE